MKRTLYVLVTLLLSLFCMNFYVREAFCYRAVRASMRVSVIIYYKKWLILTCRLSCTVFTALHTMQTRSSDENSVRLSVCLSVTRVHCDNTVERSVQIYIPYERTLILVFWEEEWLVGGDPFYVKFWVNRPPLERNRRFSNNNRS